jgi:hypothetical protein
MGKMRNTYKILIRKPDGKSTWKARRKLKVILKWMLGKQSDKAWTR